MSDLLNISQLKARFGLGKTAVYDGVKRGYIPKPIRIGGASRWIPEEVEGAIEKLKTRRDEPAPVTRRGRPRKTIPTKPEGAK